MIGGGSSINVQSGNRGLPRDHDEWRDLGAVGWAWGNAGLDHAVCQGMRASVSRVWRAWMAG